MKPPKSTGQTYLLYARVSPKGSSWDGCETSIPVQLEEMRRYVLRMDPDAAFIEVSDEFRSGKDLKRPGMQRILKDLKRRPVRWQNLVVWNLDRLTRSLSDALPLLTLLRDAGCGFVSINQEFLQYTGAMSRFMMHQTIAVAELERAMTAERVAAKMRYIAEQGKVPYGCVPIGYKRRPGGQNETVVDEEKAPLVQKLFRSYADGTLSFAEIHRQFPFVTNRQTLYRMLRNKFYTGVLVYGGQEYASASPALVDPDLFRRVQDRLATLENVHRHASRSCTDPDPDRRKYILSGLVDCSCGRKMTGYSVLKKGKRYHYYKCTSPTCGAAINADVLENGILDEICKAFSDPEKVRAAASEYLENKYTNLPGVREKLADLETQRAQAETDMQRITEAFLSGVVGDENKDFFNQRLTDARTRLSCLNGQIDQVSRPSGQFLDQWLPALLETALDLIKNVRSGTATADEKRKLLMGVVQKIEVKQREKSSITFRLDLVVMSYRQKWLPVVNLLITAERTLPTGYHGPHLAVS